MNAELKKKWCDALRSGKYEQGRLNLCMNEQYCCLGVLCHVIDPKIMEEYSTSGNCGRIYDTLLPSVGVDDYSKSRLISLNDGGTSFNKIASWIENNL